MSIKARILLLTILPLLLITAVVMVVSSWRLMALEAEEVDHFREQLISSKQTELKNYMQMTMTAIQPYYDMDDKEGAKDVMRRLRYADDQSGYIFVYDYTHTNMVHGAKPSLEGKDMAGVQDPDGKYLVRDLVDIAKKGGGFYTYLWPKPNSEENEAKLSYAMGLDKWQWMMGTGFYIGEVERQVALQKQFFQNALNTTLMWLFGIGALAAALTIIISLILVRQTVSKITASVEVMEDIAQGDGDLTRRLEVEGNTEMDQLAGAFNRFAAKVHDIICQVTDATEELSHSSSEISTLARQQSDAMGNQHSEIEQVATAMNEMTATAQEVASSASEGANSANQAHQQSEQGQRILDATISSIRSLDSRLEEAASVIKTLETETENIGSVLGVIGGIAEQTNLLALNAAIEAARAGEQGRGFAVVADEVRTLASRTQDSTAEIQEMINRLQQESAQAVSVMTVSREQSSTSVDQATQAGESLQSIVHSINAINDMTTQIASAAEEQTAVADEINNNVTRISDISSETTIGLESTASGASSIQDLGGRLQQLVSQFRVDRSK
ncbi:methyl-accepting chemotaxis protein [Aestuariirhabdus sp. Z084]|uniref:methyl-accepting chemotaxis protein n=1 Tax=Aestuariirhabdus haliotis TaxID=2918751 RepID=UPI00201B4350|nr:methyl-accepting chemotaxis protein [Aestuariirhabdus haliotis]MCL6415951.1 methyl-accepting chemotaxis protein [Aestuariirhabdus haliotis]MCL6419949.1 methyl-accepting chemotaxis protein [Aestuariirhabdus haliotis]